MGNSLFGKDYDDVQVSENYTLLQPGGYVCSILQARVTEVNNLPAVEIMFDIIDGEYTQYFSKVYRQKMAKDPNAAYPSNGKMKVGAVSADGNTKKNFKSLCVSVEKSNDITLPKDDVAFLNALKGKEVGILFGRKQFIGNDGEKHWYVRPMFFRSTESIMNGDFTVPEDELVDDTAQQVGSLFGNTPVNDSFSALEDSIPF